MFSIYIYLICAEIVSVMLRQKGRIKGINKNEKDFVLSQFADDTTVCLDGSEEYITECIKTLEAFTLMAGQKLNNSKIHLV